MGRVFFTFLLAVIIAGVAAWYFELIEQPGTNHDGEPVYVSTVPAPAELGKELYPPTQVEQKETIHELPSGRDAVAIPATLAEIDKIDVPAQVGGRILYVGDGVPEGVTQVAGVAAFLQSGYKQTTISHKGYDLIRFYKPLERGNEVITGQMVAEIDPAQALYAYLQHKTLLKSADYELKSAIELDQVANDRLEVERKLGRTIVSDRELSDAILTRVRTKFELAKAYTAIEKEQTELDAASLNLAKHEVRPKRNINRAYIKQIYHDTDEAVKEFEPILQLYSIDRLMAEAFVDIQYVQRLRPDPNTTRLATIEPVIDQEPLRRFVGHRKYPITGVSFVSEGKNTYLVSAGEDGFIKMWHQQFVGTIPGYDLYHGGPIRAMATSPVGAKETLCLAGLSDGVIHVWNLFADGKRSPKKVAEPISAHNDAVTALAFSQDGAYFASGAADGSIKLWRAADAKLVYAFDPAHGVDNPHQGAVTSLHFTPQAKLVSAARDNTIRVWALKEKGAHLERMPIAGRSGTVQQLGVSRDGRLLLFDQGKSLELLSVTDGRTVNALSNPGTATSFETLSIFAPGGDLILTAGGRDGRMQLWRAPAEAQRGFEVRQYVTDERAAVTCAAFAPAAANGSQFAASGSKDGFVYLWPVPSKQEVDTHRILNVPVKLLAKNVEFGSGQVRLGVEVNNEEGRLTPGRPVTIVFE
jgi:WD40 repeat protein